jgi:uncharacterized membrane protein YagU involved in acid resistance
MLIAAEVLKGLVAGLTSTAVMSLLEYPIWRRWGLEMVTEWHLNQVIAGRLLRRSPNTVIVQGLLFHILHGGLAGIVFVSVLSLAPNVPINDAAVGFGLILWVVSLFILKPVTGVGLRGHPLGLSPFIVSLTGHILYGMSLGLLVNTL